MNHYLRSGTAPEAGISSDAAGRCLALLSSIGCTNDIELFPADAGVWNNVVLEAVTPQQTYYFKQYRAFADIANYSPPRIPAEQRAQVAQIAQAAATESFVDSYRLVPAILASDDTAFLMEAIPQTNHLHTYLSLGDCPESITTILPRALARFHTATNRIDDYTATALDDTQFRDYKVDLQYNNVARSLDGRQRTILENFAKQYKRQKTCMAHGDLNSKNVLIGPTGAVHVIDFEQAHLGTPAYDLAFILSELFIAEAQFKQNPAFHNLCRSFAERYLDTLEGYDLDQVAKEATIHLAAQIIYRFTGPSHTVWTSYVGDGIRGKVIEKATTLITSHPHAITDIL